VSASEPRAPAGGDFDGRVVVVTAGASFLGEAIGTDLIAAGARVVLGDRDAEHGAAAAARLGDGASFVVTDVTGRGPRPPDRRGARAARAARRRRRATASRDERLASDRAMWNRVLDANVSSTAC
jgi:NAD(P)-dependent dehydrogenase (short-subunit alcohol dehydrogenase family)